MIRARPRKGTPLELARLQFCIVDALEDVKALDIRVFDVRGLTGLFDRVVVASGTSNRQTRALAKNVHDKVKSQGGEVLSTEGEDTGEWVLVDCGEVVVHIMQPNIRDYYRLEEIWGSKPLSIADIVAPYRLPPEELAKPRRKPTAKKPLAEKAPAKKPAAKKPAAKKPAEKKPAAQKPAAKKPAAKKPAAKK